MTSTRCGPRPPLPPKELIILSGPSPRPAPRRTQPPARGATPATVPARTTSPPTPPRPGRLHRTLHSWTAAAPNPTAPARHRLRALLTALQVPADTADDAVVMAGELVANAHRHAPGAGRLLLLVTATTLRVEVHDGDPRLPEPAEADHPDRLDTFDTLDGLGGLDDLLLTLAENGRGLRIVHALSGGRWGSHRTPHGKQVWFALPRPPSPGRRRPPEHPGG
ncbi:ATP-binding protein [Kitasatospora sp. LaBMicrA B282]|uniref:ATP-binding protein n=1 Tax=Kitasatospora sp. LaBMicrA B282 TaxID=3420949 RepID=UPI003D130A2C